MKAITTSKNARPYCCSVLQLALLAQISIILLLLTSRSSAATATWIGSNGDWITSSNWSNGVPGALDTAVISNSSTVTLSASAGITALNLATLASSNSATLIITAGSSLNISGGVIMTSQPYSCATINQQGGVFNVGGIVNFGCFTSSRNAYYNMLSGTFSAAGTVEIGNAGNGFFYHSGGVVSAKTFGIGYCAPGAGANTALYQISGGSLTATNLVVGNTTAYGGTTIATLEVVGSKSAINVSNNFTINNTATSTSALRFHLDQGGITKVYLTGTGAVTLGGSLGMDMIGGVALASSTSFRLLDFPGTAAISGSLTSTLPAVLWAVPSSLAAQSGRQVFDVPLNPAASKGTLAYSSASLAQASFDSAPQGYVTMAGLQSGTSIYIYLNVNTGPKTVTDLLNFFTQNGVTATASDQSGYNIRLCWTAATPTSYFIWDVTQFTPSATVSAVAMGNLFDIWTGPSGYWNMPSNWSEETVPGCGDTAVISDGRSSTVNLDTSAGTVLALNIGTIANGDSGTLIIGPNSSLATSYGLTMTNQPSSSGTINQQGGVFNVGGNAVMGRFTSARNASYSISSGTFSVAGTLQLGSQGNGSFYHSGGLVSTQGLSIGYNTPGIGLSNALYQISGGSLAAANLILGNTLINSGTMASTFEVIGSKAAINVSSKLTINNTENSTTLLNFHLDQGGVTKIYLTGTGAVALGGTLSLDPMGGIVLTSSTCFRLLDFPGTAAVSGSLTSTLPAALWTVPSSLATQGGRQTLDIPLNPAASKGSLAYSSSSLAQARFGSAPQGYVTMTSLPGGTPVYVYLNVDTAGRALADLLSFFNQSGAVATTSDQPAYNVRICWTGAASSSYLIWDLTGFPPSATVSRVAVGDLSNPGADTWTGGVSGDWNSSSNWTADTGIYNRVPSAMDTANISGVPGCMVMATSNVGTIANMEIGTRSGTCFSGKLVIGSGAVINTLGNATMTNIDPSSGSIDQQGGIFSIGGNLNMGRFSPSRNAAYTMETGTLNVSGIVQIGNQGNGSFDQYGGTVSANIFSVGYANPAAGTNTALYQLSGNGILSATSIILGNAAISSGSTTSEFDIIGSAGTVSAVNSFTIYSNAKSATTLSYEIDNGGTSTIGMTTPGAATLGGTLAVVPSGGMVFTTKNSFRLLDFPSATAVSGWFSATPMAVMWSTPSSMTIQGSEKVLDVTLQSAACRGTLAYSGLTLTGTTVTPDASQGYVTFTNLVPGDEVYLYMTVNTGTVPVQKLITALTDSGQLATSSDRSGYNVRIKLSPAASTSYLIWDLSEFASEYSTTATVSAVAIAGVLEPGAGNYVKNSGFERGISPLWTWQNIGSAQVTCTLDNTTPHWEANSVLLNYTGSTQTGKYGQLTQIISGLNVGSTYYAYVWCKGNSSGSTNSLATGSTLQFQKPLPSGTFDWTCCELQFVADAPTMPIGVLLRGATTSLWMDDIYVTAVQRKDVSTLNIIGDGSTNCTAAIQSALSTYKFLYFPAGTYITNTSITLPTGACIWGSGTASNIKNVASTDLFIAAGGTTSYVGNNEISGMCFTGLDGKKAFNLTKAANVLLRNCKTEVVGLLYTNADTSNYSLITSENNLCKNFKVSYNYITNSAQVIGTAYAGIAFVYVTDAEACNNKVSYMNHGISWWGGNANYNANGAITNPRWARRIHIAYNTVSNVAAGGIWGAMAQQVNVEHNTISTCGDVALDFEGSFDCVGQYNTVSDGVNGALANFYATSNVIFRYNTVYSTDPAKNLYFCNHAGSDPTWSCPVLYGNTFTATSGIGRFFAYAQSYVTAKDNSFNNVWMYFDDTRSIAPTITGNTLLFTADTPSALTAIYVKYQNGNPNISNNIISYTGATHSNKTGINVGRYNYSISTSEIDSNTIIGCGAADICFYFNNSGTTANFNNNIVENDQIEVESSRVISSGTGNTDLSGASVQLTPLQ